VYEEFFGLERSPFKITPDTSLFFDGGRRGDILGALVYAVNRGEGIIKVVGEVGSGKTMLCRMLQLELPHNVEIVYIANPSVSPEDILFVIASELKLDVPRDASKHELVSALHHYLLERHEENRQVVMFVEEAQGMPLATLEEIRLLSNLETDQHKLLQMVLFGQPELDENLKKKSIRQLRERITHDFNLAPLGAEEIHRYLNFRMREVGYTGPQLIDQSLARQMAQHSEGLLRRINILADKMLLAAFADGTHTLTSKHLKDAVNDSGFTRLHPAPRFRFLWWLIPAAPMLVAVAAYAYWQSSGQWPWQPPLAALNSGDTPGQPVVKSQAQGSWGNPVAAKSQDRIIDPVSQDGAKPAAKPEKMADVTPDEQPASGRDDDVAAVTTASVESAVESAQTPIASKKPEQARVKLDKVAENQPLDVLSSSEFTEKNTTWLEKKLALSKSWLKHADSQGVSIQVMMRNSSASDELASYLRSEWPLDLEKTYVYEVEMKGRRIFRVFFDEFPTISQGYSGIRQLPESVRVNSPYLHSIYRMQQALLNQDSGSNLGMN
jgi:type II secretory pathway predicted ATPase ExeA/septal ring-binding cell division protein DamX